MGLKEFLKPTKGKILLSVILFIFFMWFIIILISPIVSMSYIGKAASCCENNETELNDTYKADCENLAHELYFSSISIMCSDYERNLKRVSIYSEITFVAIFLISYLLSCLIIFAYNKYRGKKQKH